LLINYFNLKGILPNGMANGQVPVAKLVDVSYEGKPGLM